jgi:predicted metal-dependent hydrolase
MDERFYEGIREFNEGRYFEAHDILEDLWQGYREPDVYSCRL